MENQEIDIVNYVIAILDIITVLLLEDIPVQGVVFIALVEIVTEDKLTRMLFILLVIVLNFTITEGEKETIP